MASGNADKVRTPRPALLRGGVFLQRILLPEHQEADAKMLTVALFVTRGIGMDLNLLRWGEWIMTLGCTDADHSVPVEKNQSASASQESHTVEAENQLVE